MTDFERAMLALQCRILRAVQNEQRKPELEFDAILHNLQLGRDSDVLEQLGLKSELAPEPETDSPGESEGTSNDDGHMARLGHSLDSKSARIGADLERRNKR